MGNSHSSAYSKLPGYPFITVCPSCEKNESIIWCHASDGGLEKIDEEGNIHCEKCSLDKFIMDLRYDCGNHNNTFLGPNWKRMVYAISQIAVSKILDDNSCEKICEKILVRYYSQKIDIRKNFGLEDCSINAFLNKRK